MSENKSIFFFNSFEELNERSPSLFRIIVLHHGHAFMQIIPHFIAVVIPGCADTGQIPEPVRDEMNEPGNLQAFDFDFGSQERSISIFAYLKR